MTLLPRLLVITFVESIGTILLERGLYFYTHERLSFGEEQNLLLALAFGVAYVLGALGSHRLALWLGQKSALNATLYGLLALHALLAVFPSGLMISASFVAIGLLHGLKWPIIESFYSAGQTPAQLARGLGRFNVCWALAVPAGVAGSGPIIDSTRPELLFVLAGVLNVVALVMCRALPPEPLHLEHGHPERPEARELDAYAALLTSARWSLLLSYTLMFLLAPLMPAVFSALGLQVQGATLAAAALDVARVSSFAALAAYTGWRLRWLPVLIATVAAPGAFVMIVSGSELGVVLAGELIFGFAAGMSYTTALYYALVVKNAAVDAGGAHEGLIGLGFALGPLCGLAGSFLLERGLAVQAASATCLAVSPVVLLCCLGALLTANTARKLGG